MSDLVVNARLFVHRAAEPCTGDANQGPAAVVVDDEGATAVPQAGVHLPLLVTRAEHLRVKLQQQHSYSWIGEIRILYCSSEDCTVGGSPSTGSEPTFSEPIQRGSDVTVVREICD